MLSARARRSTLRFEKIMPLDKMVFYQTHPVEFVEDYVLDGHEDQFITDQQKEILNAVVNHRRVAVRSGRGIGKTVAVVWIILWWMSVFAEPRVVATAPSQPQLQSVLWPALGQWLKQSHLVDYFTLTATKFYLNEDPTNSFAEPRTASKEESLQGLHAKNLLLIMDEAPGIDDAIYNMLQGSLSQANNKIIQIGNPFRTSGFFYDAFHKFSHRWFPLAFSSEDSPIVDKKLIEDFETQYGRLHALFKVHIQGEFPSGDPDAFIPLEDVQLAVIRGETIEPGLPIEVGVDVARMGDDLTVVAWRQGLKVHPLITKEKTTVPETADIVIKTIKEIREKTGYEGAIKIKVDDSGVGGGVTDILMLDRENNIEVIPCNFGGAGDEKYENEASIMWGNVKEQINDIGLPHDVHLVRELAARRWDLSGRGKIWIEPKKKFKIDFKGSPDRADAVVLCFSGKKQERRVLKNFDPVAHKVFEEEALVGETYCSLYYSKEMQISIVWAKWDGSNLTVVENYVGSDTVGVDMIMAHAPYKKIVGNKLIFAKDGEDLFYEYSKFGIYITENYNYNEFGAVLHLDKMNRRGTLRVMDTCQLSIDQLDHWTMVSKVEKELTREYGLCYALLHIISLLIPPITPKVVEQYEPYGGKKDNDNVNAGFLSI